MKEKALANGVELFVNLETTDEALIESINMTLTCRTANLPRLRQELDAIVASFRPT